jgi:dGTPase
MGLITVKTNFSSRQKFNTQDREILSVYRNRQLMKEEEIFNPHASYSRDHHRLTFIEDDLRLPYKRDVDRIIHSKAYPRYADKTQVVYLVDNDHITYRNLHVQLVSSFARGIAEILRLNVNLVEAISLGHDVGHPPFAHEGEGYLSALSREYGEGAFAHPWQSCRLFSDIEPLNLGLAVYDGFLCHDGGMNGPEIVPSYGKTWEDHFAEKESKLTNPEKNLLPGTLEGCLVKLCDTISYLGKDIEDAISLGILKRESIPETIVGRTNQEMLSVLAQDMIMMSYDKERIALSDEVYNALKELRAFNFNSIYMHPLLKVESKKVERSYRILFETLLTDFEKSGKRSHLWLYFLHNKTDRYLEGTSPVRKVIDYIAGMTDSYFVRTLQKLIVPNRIELPLC